MHMHISGTYYAAVLENRADFSGRVVVDVGAGSGILSLFAAQVFTFSSIIYLTVLYYSVSQRLNHLLAGWCEACLCCGGI